MYLQKVMSKKTKKKNNFFVDTLKIAYAINRFRI
jgi:hypothetical protein